MMNFVRGQDAHCQAGEGNQAGDILTSGDASQCSDLSKKATVEECREAQAFNKANNIDNNQGMGGTQGNWAREPSGCFYHSDTNKYL